MSEVLTTHELTELTDALGLSGAPAKLMRLTVSGLQSVVADDSASATAKAQAAGRLAAILGVSDPLSKMANSAGRNHRFDVPAEMSIGETAELRAQLAQIQQAISGEIAKRESVVEQHAQGVERPAGSVDLRAVVQSGDQMAPVRQKRGRPPKATTAA